MIRELEERALNAWPGMQHLLYDGWLLNFAHGYTRRANCVNVLSAGRVPMAEKIAWCEEQYRARQLRTVIKITPLSQPETLDRLLEEKGYQFEAASEVLYAPMTSLRYDSEVPSDTVMLPQEAWLKAFAHVTGQSPDGHDVHRAILQAIALPCCPVAILQGGNPVAVGLGVLERGMVGFYDVATAASCRRQGMATRIFSTILTWAAGLGAQATYLQVMAENLPAMTFYTRLGFQRCYRYWYRVKEG